MSKRLKGTFHFLFFLYTLLILSNWYSSYVFGFQYSIENVNWFYQLAIIVIAFFVFKKSYYILPISFVLMVYWLVTMPIFRVDIDGLKAIIYIYNFLINYNFQIFFLFLTSWTIPVISFLGIIFWYKDVKKAKSLDKHWSE